MKLKRFVLLGAAAVLAAPFAWPRQEPRPDTPWTAVRRRSSSATSDRCRESGDGVRRGAVFVPGGRRSPAGLGQTGRRCTAGQRPQEGSSGVSNAWLQRHPAPGGEFTCDGTQHTGTFSIDAGPSEYGFDELTPGQVYVQFCLTGPGTGPAQFAWFAIQRFAMAR